MELIQSISLSSSASTILFSSIPNTYSQLYLYASLRNDSTTSSSPALRVALSSTANYDLGYRETGSSSVNEGNYSSKVSWQDMYGGVISEQKPSNSFGAFYMSIHNYAQSVPTTMVAQGTSNSSESNPNAGVYGGIIRNTDVQSSINMIVDYGNFKAGCLVALYGA